MFTIAGQTAGPNGLTFLERTHGLTNRNFFSFKNLICFAEINFFFLQNSILKNSTATLGPSIVLLFPGTPAIVCVFSVFTF